MVFLHLVLCVVCPWPLSCHSYMYMALDGEAWSDLESVGECDHPYEPYPFEEYDVQHAKYLQCLVLKHLEQMYLLERGLLKTDACILETEGDFYYKNMYTISWFYEGCYPFENWEENYEQWLYERVCIAMTEE